MYLAKKPSSVTISKRKLLAESGVEFGKMLNDIEKLFLLKVNRSETKVTERCRNGNRSSLNIQHTVEGLKYSDTILTVDG